MMDYNSLSDPTNIKKKHMLGQRYTIETHAQMKA